MMEYTVLTRKLIDSICRQHTGCYTTPKLNNVLYLNHQKIKQLNSVLDEYTELTVLHLNHNSIELLSHLDRLSRLHSLYLHYNSIGDISNCFDKLIQLNTLNLSYNRISTIPYNIFQYNINLQSLNLSHNSIVHLDELNGLLSCCNTLTMLDISHNHITLDNNNTIVQFNQFIKQFISLHVLYLYNNPCTTQIQPYRKSLIAWLPKLTYLDSTPVFENERRLVDAYMKYGTDGEKIERECIHNELYGPTRKMLDVVTGDNIQATNDNKSISSYHDERKEGESDDIIDVSTSQPSIDTSVTQPLVNQSYIDQLIQQQNHDILIQHVINKYRNKSLQSTLITHELMNESNNSTDNTMD